MKIFNKYALDINCLVQNTCLQRSTFLRNSIF